MLLIIEHDCAVGGNHSNCVMMAGILGLRDVLSAVQAMNAKGGGLSATSHTFLKCIQYHRIYLEACEESVITIIHSWTLSSCILQIKITSGVTKRLGPGTQEHENLTGGNLGQNIFQVHPARK